jgi:Na+/H+-translocating membrane pyrophosphatase
MKRLLKLIKNIIVFTALFFFSYFLSVIAVLLLTFCFFRDANPRLETVMLVFGLLIPVISISGAIVGMRFFIKRGRKKENLEI